MVQSAADPSQEQPARRLQAIEPGSRFDGRGRGYASGDTMDELRRIYEFEVELAPDSRAPALARRALRAHLQDIDPTLLERSELLVSELVTNSVRHGRLGPGDTIAVHVRAAQGSLRAEVRDTGVGFHAAIRRTTNAGSGWGMYLVDRIARSWGIDRSTNGSCIWFELGHRGALDATNVIRERSST